MRNNIIQNEICSIKCRYEKYVLFLLAFFSLNLTMNKIKATKRTWHSSFDFIDFHSWNKPKVFVSSLIAVVYLIEQENKITI